MTPFSKQVQVDIAQRGQKTVRVIKSALAAVDECDDQAVPQRRRLPGKEAYEQRVMQAFHFVPVSINHHPHPGRAWDSRPHHGTRFALVHDGMDAQQVMRRLRFAAHELTKAIPSTQQDIDVGEGAERRILVRHARIWLSGVRFCHAEN